MNYKITWQKPNGELIDRIITNYPIYSLGYVNSYDWQVVDIKKQYNDSWIDINEYNKRIQRSISKEYKKRAIKNKIEENKIFIFIVIIYIISKFI